MKQMSTIKKKYSYFTLCIIPMLLNYFEQEKETHVCKHEKLSYNLTDDRQQNQWPMTTQDRIASLKTLFSAINK